jgi:hypothetical protein
LTLIDLKVHIAHMAAKFRTTEITAMGQPVSAFMRRYGYERRTLRRVEDGTARADTIARVERDFAEFKSEFLSAEGRREDRKAR